MEYLPFLLEFFSNNNDINIYINKNTDGYNFLDYFQTLYRFKVIYDNFSKEIIDNHDKIFKLSSNDMCCDHCEIISLLHLKQLKCKSGKYLSLTPYINGDNIYYTFPIYRPPINNSENNKIVTLIGYYKNSNFDKDTIDFIKINKNYTFNFIIWADNEYPNLKNIKNVNIYHALKTSSMIKIINNSKYILSKKYINHDRFSGQLSLAMSFEKPLIIDLKSKTVYDLPGIAFKENYCEVGNLDSIDNNKYNYLKEEIKIKKKEMLDNNNKILNSL